MRGGQEHTNTLDTIATATAAQIVVVGREVLHYISTGPGVGMYMSMYVVAKFPESGSEDQTGLLATTHGILDSGEVLQRRRITHCTLHKTVLHKHVPLMMGMGNESTTNQRCGRSFTGDLAVEKT